MFNFTDHPHRRYNPLSDEWVLVSPHRTKRPWQGQVETTPPEQRPSYDPNCYLCPGNGRLGGARNPAYERTFVFTNDFAALLEDTPPGSYVSDGGTAGARGPALLHGESQRGTSRVICYSPRHDLTLGEMDAAAIAAVVDVWAEQYAAIGALEDIGYVQIFENRGAMMGSSLPHPHGQIWATQSVPSNVAREQAAQAAYLAANGRPLLLDYLAQELAADERIVCANDGFVALVPFWAVWPFEIMLLPRRHVGAIDQLDASERQALADLLKRVATRYDNLFHTMFPYSMGFHQRPTDGQPHAEWQLHAHFYPPLLRSATVRKFMVGYELLAEAQRDITPEQAASRLRDQSETHYRAG